MAMRSVHLGGLLVLGWALAPAAGASAPDAGPDSGQRLQRLAQRLAQGQPEPAPAASAAEPTTTMTGAGAAGRFGDGDPLQPATAPTAPSMPSPVQASDSAWLARTAAALGAVLGLILLLRAALLRMGRQTLGIAPSPVVEVLSRVRVGPRSRLLLMRLGRRLLLVSESGSGLQTLATVHEADEVADLLQAVAAAGPHGVTGGFSQLLARIGRPGRRARQEIQEGADDAEFRLDRARDQVSRLLARVRGEDRGEGST